MLRGDDLKRERVASFSVLRLAAGGVDFTHSAGRDEAQNLVGAERAPGEQHTIEDLLIGDICLEDKIFDGRRRDILGLGAFLRARQFCGSWFQPAARELVSLWTDA